MAAPSAVEIVVLGKGVGESVLIGLGSEWVVVDSFETAWPGQEGRPPAPLAYLRSRGIDPATVVKGIVLSHLHTDHCRGIDSVVHACPEAKFFLPYAIPDEQWGRILAIESSGDDRRTLDVVASAFRIASDRDAFRAVGATGILDIGCDEVRVVGPSHRASQDARTPFGEIDPVGAKKLLDKNYTSIVLLVVAGAAVALLGADMDADARLGWPRLLSEHRDKTWLSGAGLVKVPHHGSATAFDANMYATWSIDPIGLLAPNGSRLPTAAMIESLKNVTRELYKAGPRVQRTLDFTDTEAPSETYVVRATCSRAAGSQWQVDPPTHPHQVL